VAKHYPLAKRIEVLDWMTRTGSGCYSAARHFEISETTLHRWKRTKSKWYQRGRLAATIRVLDGGDENDPNQSINPVDVETAYKLRSILTRNLDYLALDDDLGSERHKRCSAVVTQLTREWPQLLACTQSDLSAALGIETTDEDESTADTWINDQLRLLQGGVAAEAK